MKSQTVEEAKAQHSRQGFRPYRGPKLEGPRAVVPMGSREYPDVLLDTRDPPDCLYVVGNPGALNEGLAVIGARKATPYGLSCARHFAGMAARAGVTIVSGGALGCDSEAHKAALEEGGATVAFLGGGCDCPYPAGNFGLFQDIVDAGGAIVSEHPWDFPALPYAFRNRNRLIAGLARATLIVEAGLPSGTFSTADEALAAGKDVLVVPGAITSKTSAGSNRLLYQGATPVIDDETFSDSLFNLFGCLKIQQCETGAGAGGALGKARHADDPLYRALCAQPMRICDLPHCVDVPPGQDGNAWIAMKLAELEGEGLVTRYPDGRYGPASL